MKEDDWKKAVSIWHNSKKKKQLEMRRKMIIMIKMTKENIEEMIQASFDYHQLDTKDKEELDFLNDQLMIGSPDDIVASLTQTLIQLNYHIITMERKEEFEMCAQMMKIIDMEIEEANRLLQTYHSTFLEDDFIQTAKEETKFQTQLNYEIWSKM
jgi:hypothetical protein